MSQAERQTDDVPNGIADHLAEAAFSVSELQEGQFEITTRFVGELFVSGELVNEISVQRSFRDFEWIHSCLNKVLVPGSVVPPFPSESLLRDCESLVRRARRCFFFRKLVTFSVLHPELKGHKVVINFLTEGQKEFRTIQSFIDSNREAERLRMFTARGKSLKGLDAMSVNLGAVSKSRRNRDRISAQVATLPGASVNQYEASDSSMSAAVARTDSAVTSQVRTALLILDNCYSQLRSSYRSLVISWDRHLAARVEFSQALAFVLVPNMRPECEVLKEATQEACAERTWEPRQKFVRASETDFASFSPGLETVLQTRVADLGTQKSSLQQVYVVSRERAHHDTAVFERKQKALEFAAARTPDLKALAVREEQQQVLEETARRSAEECLLTGLRLLRDSKDMERRWVGEARHALVLFAKARRDDCRATSLALESIMAQNFDDLTVGFRRNTKRQMTQAAEECESGNEDEEDLGGFRFSVVRGPRPSPIIATRSIGNNKAMENAGVLGAEEAWCACTGRSNEEERASGIEKGGDIESWLKSKVSLRED